MNADQIMDALGSVKEDFIMEAAPGKKTKKKSGFRWIAAVVALVMVLTFFQTAPGAAAVETVRKAVTNFIERLFPPKEVSVTVEGETEVVHQEAGGQEPEVQEDGTITTPGFAIYYDTENYTMSEENGVTYIRFVMDNDLPPCEVEIRHIPGKNPAEAAAAAQTEMVETWAEVSELMELEDREGVMFHVSAGMNWDSACENIHFLSDGADGCFRITARYFVEAAEGHGVRVAQMIGTFQVIDSPEE